MGITKVSLASRIARRRAGFYTARSLFREHQSKRHGSTPWLHSTRPAAAAVSSECLVHDGHSEVVNHASGSMSRCDSYPSPPEPKAPDASRAATPRYALA